MKILHLGQLLDHHAIGEVDGVKVNEPANDARRRNNQPTIVRENLQSMDDIRSGYPFQFSRE